jgi:class 3 adenylate cyclase/DNA-binding CsgD family transcriptional regulator
LAAVVTLLFTDLVGSTELLDQLGDDAGEQVRRTHFRLLREAVLGAGGQEVKNLGDGLMVVFESAVAGVECAVAIQRAIERHNRTRRAQTLAVRVGLHVGEPIHDDDDYFGTSVVVAKRLCDAAGGGQILASDLVRGLVGTRGGFAFSPLGPVKLKGLAEPLVAHDVRWAPEPAATRLDPAAVPADPGALRLVGRDEELETLDVELAVAAGGQLRAVLLVGDAGIGKTRLATELVARHAGSAIGLSARAYPLGATASLGLWVEALERHLRTLEPHEVVALCGADAADLAALLPSVAAAGAGRPVTEPPRIRLLGALANLLARLAACGPLVIVLDDVHLADGSSWEALNYLAHNLAAHPILLVLAARPLELAAQAMASEMLLGLEQEGFLVRRHLRALSTGELRELAEDFPGVEHVGDALVGWLMERSQGSPLFAAGLLRALLDEGADLARPELRVLPEDLTERVGVRLRQIEPASRAVLEMLAVVGYRVGISELLSLCGHPLGRLAEILDGLVLFRIVAEEEQGRDLTYEVAHPLYAEAVYRSIGGARRRALHRHVAQTLVAAERPGPAAAHFVRSADVGDPEAVDALRDALAQAEARQLHREAIALLDALLELLPAGDRRWLDVFDAMAAQPEWVVDHRADVGAATGIEAMRRVDALLAGSSDLPRRAAVSFNLSVLLSWGAGDVEAAIPLAEEARRLFAEAGDVRSELLVANELGYLIWIGGNNAAYGAAVSGVLRQAEAVGDRFVVLQALCSHVHFRQYSGELVESLPVIDRATAIAREDHKLYRVSYLAAQKALTLASLGRMAEARARLAEGKAVTPAFRDTLLLDFSMYVDWLGGELENAVATFREQMAWTGAPSRRRTFGATPAAMCAAELGDLAGATAIVDLFGGVFGERDWVSFKELLAWAGGVVAFLGGDGAWAWAALLPCVRSLVGQGWGLSPYGRGALADLGEIAAHLADPAAGALVTEILDETGPGPDRGPLDAVALLARGGAALGRKESEEAAEAFRAASASFEECGWPLFQGRALALLGRATAVDDRDGALDALGRAAVVFDACGAVVRRRWVAEDMRRLGARGRRAAARAVAGPAALTKREREVARLAIEGRTAKEIAAALFIGERTVETHLAGAYAKLGVSSRVELVRLGATLEL